MKWYEITERECISQAILSNDKNIVNNMYNTII